MQSAIRELYDGETFPAERWQEMSKEYVKVLEYQERHENDLLATLTQAQKETFEKYKDLRLGDWTGRRFPRLLRRLLPWPSADGGSDNRTLLKEHRRGTQLLRLCSFLSGKKNKKK